MRVKIEIISKKGIVLPKGFVKTLQGFIYNMLEPYHKQWLHEKGFIYENRRFKLFNFSYPLERAKFKPEKDLFYFPSKLNFYLSSPVDWILERLVLGAMKQDKLYLGNNEVYLQSVSVLKKVEIDSPLKVKALTPIEVHTTFNSDKNKKKTYYYSPFEKDFSKLINDNARRKWSALYQVECPYSLKISPLFEVKNDYKRVVFFGRGKKRTVINGWKGNYLLEGEKEFLEFVYDAGLGSRNSQGFGMIEVAR